MLRNEAITRKIHLWVGACLYESKRWFNAALGFAPEGKMNRYNKVNYQKSYIKNEIQPIFKISYFKFKINYL